MSERIKLYTLILNLSDQFDYIALGDTDHTNEIVRNLRGDLDLFRVAEEAGYNTFTLEKPPENLLFDKIISAQINAVPDTDAEDYYKQMITQGSDPVNIVGAFAQSAYDMTAVYADPRYSPRLNLELLRAQNVIKSAPQEECQDVFLQAHWNSDPEASDFVEQEVNRGDDIIAQETEEISGGRAFIIYGNRHFTGENDLNEMLGSDDVAHIAAIASRSTGYRYENDSPEEAIDTPDFIYIIDEDAILSFDLNSPEILQIIQNYTSNNTGNLDQESFDACTAELPSNLKEHAVTQEQYEDLRSKLNIDVPNIK